MRFAGTQLSNYLDPMNFDGISTAFMEGQAKERMYDRQADFLVDKAEIDGASLIKQAKYGASATRAEGAAGGSAAMFGGLANGIGGLASGLGSKLGSTPKAPGQPIPPTMTPLNNASYLNPAAPSSLGEYSSLLDQW